ncbi:Transmembrane 9 superfamily member 2 [Mucor circinelloides]
MTKILIGLLALCGLSQAMYLPGVAPNDYDQGNDVPLFVNSLTPMSNQQKSVLSYDYYDERFHFCSPEGGAKKQAESLGSVLFGDRIFTSAFKLSLLNNEKDKLLCTSTPIPKADADFINECIKNEYALNWVVDGLPAAHLSNDERTNEEYYSIGFALGNNRGAVAELNNHYDITVDYHHREDGKYRVVGVLVSPVSRAQKVNEKGVPVPSGGAMVLKGNDQVVYSYSVNWQPSNMPWATRWDNYLHVLDPSIHWFSLVNSIVIVLFLTGMVAMILIRALHKDISRYNAVDAQEDVQEDYGWKLVHGDVFRPPQRPMLLSVLVGSGAQIVAMTGLTLVFAALGFLSPSNRGALGTVMIIFFMVFSCISGFVSARIYKMNGGENWKANIGLTASLVPGAIMSSLFAMNFFLIHSQSSGAVPFGTMFTLLGLWALIAFPLSVAGSYFGFRQPRIEHPVRTNQIPRQIPDQPMYLRSLPSIMMGGILPFGAIFIELYFIMNSIWFHRVYYGIGFLFLVFIVLILTCSQVTILMCYFHLCSEDYHWSWRSFLTSGAAGFYVFLYSILYYFTKLSISSFTSTVLYLGYSSVISILLTVFTGAVGYLSCLYFLQKIFASIKVD